MGREKEGDLGGMPERISKMNLMFFLRHDTAAYHIGIIWRRAGVILLALPSPVA